LDSLALRFGRVTVLESSPVFSPARFEVRAHSAGTRRTVTARIRDWTVDTRAGTYTTF